MELKKKNHYENVKIFRIKSIFENLKDQSYSFET